MERYRNYPRIVGETGGKDFIVAHPSADLDALAAAIVRGSFEYQGQKCSASSRVYAPSNLWPELRERLQEEVATITRRRRRRLPQLHGRRDRRRVVRDAGARRSRRRRRTPDTDIVVGGGYRRLEGYFVEPTVIETRDPSFRTAARRALRAGRDDVRLRRERRGTRRSTLVDRTAPYGAHRRGVRRGPRRHRATRTDRLRYAAGNFYVNDKPTGAVVGQQPFGGARASGTNDKAGSMWNLIRWVSPRTIKETFVAAARLPLSVHSSGVGRLRRSRRRPERPRRG